MFASRQYKQYNFDLRLEGMLLDFNQSINQLNQSTNSICTLYDHLLFSSATKAWHKMFNTKQSKNSAWAALSGLVLKPCKQRVLFCIYQNNQRSRGVNCMHVGTAVKTAQKFWLWNQSVLMRCTIDLLHDSMHYAITYALDAKATTWLVWPHNQQDCHG